MFGCSIGGGPRADAASILRLDLQFCPDQVNENAVVSSASLPTVQLLLIVRPLIPPVFTEAERRDVTVFGMERAKVSDTQRSGVLADRSLTRAASNGRRRHRTA